MNEAPGPTAALSDAAAMVNRKWRANGQTPAQAQQQAHQPLPGATSDVKRLVAAGTALLALGASLGFVGAKYWPADPASRLECHERAAKEARTDRAMTVLMMVCNRRFPE